MKPWTAIGTLLVVLISQLAVIAWFAPVLWHFHDFPAWRNTLAAVCTLMSVHTTARLIATLLSIIAMWRGYRRAMRELREEHERAKRYYEEQIRNGN